MHATLQLKAHAVLHPASLSPLAAPARMSSHSSICPRPATHLARAVAKVGPIRLARLLPQDVGLDVDQLLQHNTKGAQGQGEPWSAVWKAGRQLAHQHPAQC